MHNYTHYWKIHGWITSQDQPTWARLISDTRLVIEAAHVRLCGNYPVENGNGDDLDPPLVSDKCIAINSIDDDGHEMFELTIDDTRFDCRKTARKPYDVVVCCILLRVHVLAPQCIEVSSDSSWGKTEWEEARELYARLWEEDTLQRPPEISEEQDSGLRSRFAGWQAA